MRRRKLSRTLEHNLRRRGVLQTTTSAGFSKAATVSGADSLAPMLSNKGAQ